ncbi:peroxiredoxin [Ignatzschineria sp. F8392]|uniref:peroxiredoxin n=1 Tax=Ignatzschineria sp. F8392 TaxID=1980117 RepID=UPI000B98E2D8|nr:peroxiredoxin [Ignatzschineria sp. F8392]OYQ81723.1 peroxiredoxin [Ignatzschineria sp. F8392]
MGNMIEKVTTEILSTPYETQGEPLELDSLKEKYIVLFFYPKDNTPGCSNEVQDFNKLLSQFAELDCAVVGASRDSKNSHIKFSNKFELNFPLLSDPEETLCRAFDVIKEKKMFGKVGMGIERSTFIFDKSGTILHEWRKVKVPGHAEEVLETLKSL